MYFDGCKYGKGGNREGIKKFKLIKEATDDKENEIEETLQQLATAVSPVYARVAPDSYNNMTEFEDKAGDCRIGLKPGRPFSGVDNQKT